MTHTTRVARYVDASPASVYAALVDAVAIARWRVPDDMTSVVHEHDARVGGTSRVSLTYDDPAGEGKSDARTDTYRGRFLALDPGQRVVEELAFETDDPAFQGPMTMTTLIEPAGAGSRVVVVHEGVPDAIDPAANEVGTAMALDRLASLLEPSR